MWRREENNEIMVLLFLLVLFPIEIIGFHKEIIVENPFYLRARIYDSHTASVSFEINDETNQQTCQMYKFTIRRNREYPYSMPEQNLTYWSNSLELKHLAAGDYRVCAIICSEHLRDVKTHYQDYLKKNRSTPITACIHFHAFRPHLLVLTLYFLVIVFLVISQIMFSLRKRQFHARMKIAYDEVEKSLQKWRALQTSIDPTHSYTILQNLITIPASPIEHSIPAPIIPSDDDDDEPRPIIFNLEDTDELQ